MNLSKDELFLTLGKHLRQYIKRSKKEDVVNIRILDSEYLKSNSENISDIGKIYEIFGSDYKFIFGLNLV